jgi:serine/threonine protein kinase
MSHPQEAVSYQLILLGYSLATIQSIARQSFKALSFLHSHGLTHTDLKVKYTISLTLLKPENILFKYDEYD